MANIHNDTFRWEDPLLFDAQLDHEERQIAAAAHDYCQGRLLPRIREACGDRLALILDSGVRTGDDIARSLASGADFVLLGRPFLFAVAALGLSEGPRAIIEILRAEQQQLREQLQ